MSKRIHVVPHGSGWATRREGAARVGSIHNTQADATQTARYRRSRTRRSHHPPSGRSHPGRQFLRQRPLPAEGLTRPDRFRSGPARLHG